MSASFTNFFGSDGTLSSTRTKVSGVSFNQYFGGGSDFWRSRSGLSSIKFTGLNASSIGMSCGRRMSYTGSGGSHRKI